MSHQKLLLSEAKDLARPTPPPRRSAPFDEEPAYYGDAKLWLYGNVRLLEGRLAIVSAVLNNPLPRPALLETIEREAERLVLDGYVIVTGIHNSAHQRAAVVPLRWGSPRVLVFSGGFRYHLGLELRDEPFRTARLWRYEFDAKTDLVISRRAPDRLPTYALDNPTVDRLVCGIASRELPGVLFQGRTSKRRDDQGAKR